jgi:hypothetical protein
LNARVTFGRIGCQGRTQRHDFDDEAATSAFIRARLRRRGTAEKRLSIRYRVVEASSNAQPLLRLVGVSHRLTAKAGVLKVETLNVRSMARNRHLALSVADTGMSRLVTFCRYKADRRVRRVVDLDPWFPGSQTCCQCGALHPEMKQLSRRKIVCGCGNRMGRDRNAAGNHYWYGEERRNRSLAAPTLVEIGSQGSICRLPSRHIEIICPEERPPFSWRLLAIEKRDSPVSIIPSVIKMLSVLSSSNLTMNRTSRLRGRAFFISYPMVMHFG